MSSDKQPASAALAPPSGRICETRAISDIAGFADCLTKCRGDCGYAVPFGSGLLCFNPKWRQFEIDRKKFSR